MSPHYSTPHAGYLCSRHQTIANAESCHNSIRVAVLDELVSEKLLDALSPAGVELSLRVIEDEVARRNKLDLLHTQRMEQARYEAELAERRFKEVDPANRLVAGTLEQEWEAALHELHTVSAAGDERRDTQPTKLTDKERQQLLHTCENVAALWRERATIEQRKQIVRLLLRRVVVDVQNNSERVSVRLHWSGGFESCYETTRIVMRFDQLETHEQLLSRLLELALTGESTPQTASILEAEGYYSPRTGSPISSHMVQKLLSEEPRLRQRLHHPTLAPGQWRSADLATELGIPEKRLKDWVTRGWATAIQRPRSRQWVIFADNQEQKRLQQLVREHTGQGRRRPKELRKPASIMPTNQL